MQTEKQKDFGEIISSKIAEIRSQLSDKDRVGDPVSPDSSIGRLSRVDAMQLQEMRLALVRQKKEE